MSDTDADDSGFDKEAERERLREKYGEEDDDRAATERMSELLLQGATMTNRHCGTCGNPIFRYEGQSFCAVCEEARPEDGQASPTAGADGSTATEAHGEDPSPPGETADQESREPAPEMDLGERRQDRPDQDAYTSTREGPDTRPDPEAAAPDEVAAPDGVARRGAPRPERPTGEGGAEIQAARASLLRTLNRMADQAESTAEVDRSRDYLAAAREAAEALAALDRVRQR